SHTLNMTWHYIKDLGPFDYLISFGGHLSIIGAPIYAKWLETKLIVFLRGNDFDASIFTLRKREALQYALEEAHITFSVSNEKLQKINRWLPQSNSIYVPNGIDLSEWTPTQSEIGYSINWRNENIGNKICLGLIGQLKIKKGIQFFIDAINKTNLQEEIHILLVGDVSDEDQEALDHLSFSYTLMPFLDRFELMKYYLCCDAMVIPSFYEGMPNVMLEAGALGIPIIASNVDGMADVITPSVDGLLFQVGNEDNFRKILYDFMALGSKREEMGQALKEKIVTQFTAEHETQRYQKFIQ
ncbi:MAG: glycosyltransferase family 4 protein, partial [Bacteroidota bacterium]